MDSPQRASTLNDFLSVSLTSLGGRARFLTPLLQKNMQSKSQALSKQSENYIFLGYANAGSWGLGNVLGVFLGDPKPHPQLLVVFWVVDAGNGTHRGVDGEEDILFPLGNAGSALW